MIPTETRSSQFPNRTEWLRHFSLVFVWNFALTMALIAHRTWPFGWLPFAATFGLCLASAILCIFHLRHTPLKVASWITAERIIGLVLLMSVGGVQLIHRNLVPHSMLGGSFLLTAPLVAEAMLISGLLGPAIAVFALTLTCFLLGFSGAMSVDMLAISWLSGATGAHAVTPLKRRSDLLRATSIQIIAMVVLAALATANLSRTIGPVLESSAYAGLAAILATSGYWLFVAVLERLFGITSDWSLLELCSPDHPLLRELCLRAPGTYAHSVMVGNLAENAAHEIGANPVHCRAMAYFHDIGKMKRASYFIENQLGENLHDGMPPTLSAQVIAAHVRDGLALARQHKLPPLIQDGIAQHHGTTLISYFYHRALENGDMNPEFEQLFRYPGPKPRSKETAILHIADQVEAASRTMASIGEAELMVSRIIENSRAEGQFDECDLTFAELQSIHKSLIRSLGAIRHDRIPYPDDNLHEPLDPNLDYRGYRTTDEALPPRDPSGPDRSF